MPTIQKTILRYDRLRSTNYGNPRFRFTFTDGSAHDSMGNAGWAYAVGNAGMREGSTVNLELTPGGRIRLIREASRA